VPAIVCVMLACWAAAGAAQAAAPSISAAMIAFLISALPWLFQFGPKARPTAMAER
jgi:hypothetical protein